MDLDAFKDTDCDLLIQSVDERYQSIFADCDAPERRAIYRYLFSRRPRRTPPALRSRLINLYDPLADRRHRFPDGLRWCLNTYVGCQHNCSYCYVNGYSQSLVGLSPHVKKDFEAELIKDLKALRELKVPAAFLHMSNSTDPLQERLEVRFRHTLRALTSVAERQSLFSGVVMLTKNPRILTEEPYLSTVRKIEGFCLQVSCAFWREEARLFYEPSAPPIPVRMNVLEELASHGIRVEIRLDPLFPASRFDPAVRRHACLAEYGLVEAQTEDDIKAIVGKAGELNAAVIGSPLKIPISWKARRVKDLFADLYQDANSGRRILKGGSWRLPSEYQRALLQSVAAICSETGVPFRHCMHDLLSRR